MRENNTIKTITLPAVFAALGLVLPFVTAQVPAIGNMLLPMHIPVLLTGIVSGWKYGLMIGFALPLARSFLFGSPPIYPIGVSMAFELATYGAVIGFLYNFKSLKTESNVIHPVEFNSPLKKPTIYMFKHPYNIYFSLITAMIAGRIVWGGVTMFLFNRLGWDFTFQIFMMGAFFNAIPGLILQIILIPFLTILLKKRRIL